MPLSAAMRAAWSVGTLLAVSLPSVSAIIVFAGTVDLANRLMPRPMASPKAVRGPAMPTCISPTSRSESERSVVNGTSVNGASPNTTTPTRSPSRRFRKSVSTCFTAASRLTVAPLASVKSLVSIEPERSTSNRRSRAGLSKCSGGSIHCGRISAATARSQQPVSSRLRIRPRWPTTEPPSGFAPVSVTSRVKNGTRSAGRRWRWRGNRK